MGDLGIEITADGFLPASALKEAQAGAAKAAEAKPGPKVETRRLPPKPRQMPKG